jgi:hypothetical protein
MPPRLKAANTIGQMIRQVVPRRPVALLEVGWLGQSLGLGSSVNRLPRLRRRCREGVLAITKRRYPAKNPSASLTTSASAPSANGEINPAARTSS